MSETTNGLNEPDLVNGVALSRIAEGAMLLGHVHGQPMLLARRGDELSPIDAVWTHYGAPLADGLLVGGTVRCPWHHAYFNLHTGAALRVPALDRVCCGRVKQRGGSVYVREKSCVAIAKEKPPSAIIAGGAAAGNMAAETLRREGYSGRITLLGTDASAPCDRPNLSKGFLAGTSAAESNPLRPPAFYREHGIELKMDAPVAWLDTQGELAMPSAALGRDRRRRFANRQACLDAPQRHCARPDAELLADPVSDGRSQSRRPVDHRGRCRVLQRCDGQLLACLRCHDQTEALAKPTAGRRTGDADDLPRQRQADGCSRRGRPRLVWDHPR